MIAYQHLHVRAGRRIDVISMRKLTVGAACVQQVEQARHGGDQHARA